MSDYEFLVQNPRFEDDPRSFKDDAENNNLGKIFCAKCIFSSKSIQYIENVPACRILKMFQTGDTEGLDNNVAFNIKIDTRDSFKDSYANGFFGVDTKKNRNNFINIFNMGKKGTFAKNIEGQYPKDFRGRDIQMTGEEKTDFVKTLDALKKIKDIMVERLLNKEEIKNICVDPNGAIPDVGRYSIQTASESRAPASNYTNEYGGSKRNKRSLTIKKKYRKNRRTRR